jgi:hypothetical protein
MKQNKRRIIMRLSKVSVIFFTIAAFAIGFGMIGTGTLAYGQNAVPTLSPNENIGSMHSRTGSTLRGQALTESPEKAHTVQPATASSPESIGSPDSLVGRTMRGQPIKPKM